MERRPETETEAERAAARKRAREEAEAEGEDGDQAAWRPPPGVFRFPWQKCRGGLGVVVASGWELRDVFFRSLVDGSAAAIGVPGDRLLPPPPPPSRHLRALLDDVDAWLAAAADGEVDPVWRSALAGDGPAPAA